MVVDRSNVDHIMRGLQSTEGVRLHNHRKKLRQRFDIIKKLGQGTYGKVQLGINKETGQEVAIKTIKKCKIETDADLVRIRREIQIMSSVRHPNIIHIYEVFENREKIVLVMEYAAGGELYDYLSERKVLEETEARRIFRQISTAIYYCHKHKICHRDLKLENILLDEHGSAKIADFGLSNVFDGQRLLSTYCGSPLYASPEIVKGTPYHGPEVDCWSLGVLLYTLVYGAMPFDGSNFKRLVKQISQGDYFEPAKPSVASSLIRDMLTVNSPDRATIEQICSHWWVNQGFNVSCLDIAEDLANQTPVRLDLLLSLAPPPENTEKIVVTDDQKAVPQEGPPRSMSVGSFMELDSNAEERVKSFVAREVPSESNSTEKTMKRKLEPVPSKSFSGARKKERMKPDTEENEVQAPVETEQSAKAVESNFTNMEIDTESKLERNKSQDIGAKDESKAEEKQNNVETVLEKNETVKSEVETPLPEEISKDKPTRKSIKVVKKKKIEKKEPDIEKSENEPNTNNLKLDHIKTEPLDSQKKEIKTEVKKEKEETAQEKVDSDKKEKADDLTKTEIDNEKINEKEEKEKTPRPENVAAKPVERRKSKIFETAEKFMVNDQKNSTSEKPKKVYIPGVKVSDFAKAFERRSSIPTLPLKSSPSKKAVAKESSPVNKKVDLKPKEEKSELSEIKKVENNSSLPVKNQEKIEEKSKDEPPQTVENAIKEGDTDQPIPFNDEKLNKLKDSARNVITSALVEEERKKIKKQVLKPPVPRTKTEDVDNKKKNLTLQIGKETATVQVHTPENTKFLFEPEKENTIDNKENVEKPKINLSEKPKEKKTAKLEITLKSNTLPRRTTKAEVRLASPQVRKEPVNFRTEVEHRVGDPSHVYSTQRSEVAFPVSAPTKPVRAMSLEPEIKSKQIPVKEPNRERIIPISFEGNASKEDIEARDRVEELEKPYEGRVKHPYQRTWSLKSNSLSRQSTQDSDAESTASTAGEPIKKSPREFIIPIAVEGGGYVTPRATSLEPSESISKRSSRPFSRKFSLWSENGSEDESPFSTLQRHSSRDMEEPFRLHRLRSSRPTRSSIERADSGSGSEEEEDDDGFELLTAENLFSTLLSRVRSLTQRLNVEDGIRPGFPSSRLLSNHFGPSERLFSNLHQPMTRLSDRSEFRRSSSRDLENGSNIWSRGSLRNSDSSRSLSRGNSLLKRGDSDTESPSESSSASRNKAEKSKDEKKEKKLHHHSRTGSVPLKLTGNEQVLERVPSFEGHKSVYLPSRRWMTKTYDRGSIERESPSKYRSGIPKLQRPVSLLLERKQCCQDISDAEISEKEPDKDKEKEKDFYDILAKKYGITNVKRYDLPPESRIWRGYLSDKSHLGSSEKREENQNRGQKQAEDIEGTEISSPPASMKVKKNESVSEKFRAPSEKLAAVLNCLDTRSDRVASAKREVQASDKMAKSETNNISGKQELLEKSQTKDKENFQNTLIPEKVGEKKRNLKKISRHLSDLCDKEIEREDFNRKETDQRINESRIPERSVLGKYLSYYEDGKTMKLREIKAENKENFTQKSSEDDEEVLKSKSSSDKTLKKLKTPEKKYVDKAIRSLRENSLGPKDVISENVLIKKAVSLSDCPSGKNSSRERPQSTVNSVIGMFNKIENSDSKSNKLEVEKHDNGEKSKIPIFRRNNVPENIEILNVTSKNSEFNMPYYSRRLSYLTGNSLTFPKPNSALAIDDSSNFLSPDSESFDSWSYCSDSGNPDDFIPKNEKSKYVDVDNVSKESVSERIRRKSFYTRFNERKKPRRSSLLSRSYDPEIDGECTGIRTSPRHTSKAWLKPTYYRSVSSEDERPKNLYEGSRPRPFYNSQLSEGSTTHYKDNSVWTRNPSYLRSSSQSPLSHVSFTLPRNYRSKSIYSLGAERPFSPVQVQSSRPISPFARGQSLDPTE